MDEKEDKLGKIVVEVQPSIAAHAGELDEALRFTLGELFHGLNIEEIKDETHDGIFATIYVDPGLDERESERVAEAVKKFAPQPVVVTPEPSKQELFEQLQRIEQQIEVLREAIYKL